MVWALGALARLGFALFGHEPLRQGASPWFDEALRFADPAVHLGASDLLLAPGVPAVAALFIRAFGSTAGLQLALVLQALLASAVPVLLFVAARRLFSSWVALGASALAAAHVLAIAGAGALAPTSFVAFFALAALAVLDRESPKRALAAGALVALAACFDPRALVLALGWAALLALERHRKAAGAIVLGALVAATPGALLASNVAGRFVPLSTGLGLNVALGQCPISQLHGESGAAAAAPTRQRVGMAMQEATWPAARFDAPLDASGSYASVGLSCVTRYPRHALRMLALHLTDAFAGLPGRMIWPAPSGAGRFPVLVTTANVVFAYVFAPLALLGLLLGRRDPELRLAFGAPLLAVLGPALVTFGDPTRRIPWDGFFFIAAACAVEHLVTVVGLERLGAWLRRAWAALLGERRAPELADARWRIRAHRRAGAALFVALAALQLLCLEGHINTPDGQMTYAVSEAMVSRHAFDVKRLDSLPGGGGEQGVGPRRKLFFAKYGLGYSLLTLPTLLAGHALLPLASGDERGIFDAFHQQLDQVRASRPDGDRFGRALWYDTNARNFKEAFFCYFASMTSAWLVAALGTALFFLALSLGFGVRAATLLALASNFATPLWHYAGERFTEPASALMLVLVVLWARLSAESAERRWLAALAGFSAGFLVLVKLADVIALPWLALYAFLLARSFHLRGRELARWLGQATLGFAVPVAINAAYNWYRFHSVLETGYGGEAHNWTTPILSGIWGLMLSPGRGTLWYAPLVLLGVAFAPAFWRRHRAETIVGLGVFVTFLGVYARWYMWEGGWCWAPRFLVSAMPLLLLPLLELAERWRRAPTALKAAVAVVAVAAVAIAFSGVWVNYNPFTCWVNGSFYADQKTWHALGYGDPYAIYRRSWWFAPVWRFFVFPLRQRPIILTALEHPGVVLAVNLLFLVTGVLATLRFVGAYRATRAVEGKPRDEHHEAQAAAVPHAVG